MLDLPVHLSSSLALYAGATALFTLITGIGYRLIWTRLRPDGATPTGFGAMLAPIVLGAALISGAPSVLIASLIIILLMTAIYWLDDRDHLSARVRIIVSFLAGVGVGIIYLFDDNLNWTFFCFAVLISGLVSVVLTNMVNFCDGADLNLATFILLTSIMIILYEPLASDWNPVAVGLLAFILPFALMNSRPRTIYLGDSGSFAFAGILTAMSVAFFKDITKIPPEAGIPAALPALDVAYVFAVRLIEKHDLLTRNYLHLYQRLNRRHSGFGYLLPQLFNVGLCVIASMMLQDAGFSRISATGIAIIGVTLPFYFGCRALLLAGPPEGPLFETNR